MTTRFLTALNTLIGNCKERPFATFTSLAIAILGGALTYETVELWRLSEELEKRTPVERCTTIPLSGHSIEDAAAGEWAMVTWRNIERHSDRCGTPELTATVVNGDGVYHDVPTTTLGVKLDIGVTEEIRYKFQVPPTASAGRAWFRVTLTYPEDGQTLNSPRLFFTVKEKPSRPQD